MPLFNRVMLMKEKVIIKSNFKGFILFWVVTLNASFAFFYFTSKEKLPIKSYLILLLISGIIVFLEVLRCSQEIIITKESVIVRNRFFKYVKDRRFAYEDLLVEFDYISSSENSYISIRNYDVPAKIPLDYISKQQVIDSFKKFGVDVTVRKKKKWPFID